MLLTATAWLIRSLLVPGLLKGFASCYLTSLGSWMYDRSSLRIDRRVCMQFNRSNLVDVGLACKIVLVTCKPIIDSFSTSVQSFHAERTHVVQRKSVVTKHHFIVSSCRTLASGVVYLVRIRGRPTRRHTLDISMLASRSSVWPLRSGRTPCSMSP